MRWIWVLEYLDENQVADKTRIIDDEGRIVTGATFESVGFVTLAVADRESAQALTVGELKALAPGDGAADEHRLRFSEPWSPGSYQQIVDLGFREDPEGDGADYFELQGKRR